MQESKGAEIITEKFMYGDFCNGWVSHGGGLLPLCLANFSIANLFLQ